MSRKRRKEQEIPPKMLATIQKAAKTYQEIEENRKVTKAKKENQVDIKKIVQRIVDSIENKKKLDILAYDALVKRFPQTKNTVDGLISELRIFSIYDSEPSTVNFDYSAYLQQIEALADIG